MTDYSVSNIADLVTQAQSATLAYGDRILCHAGTYGDGVTAYRIRRSTPLVGTFVAPTDKTPSHQGPNLSTGNYCQILPHPGETVIIPNLQVSGQLNNAGGFRFTGLNFTRTAVADVPTVSASAILLLSNSINNIAIDGCTFSSTPSVAAGTDVQRYNGLRVATGTYNGLKIIDNSFSYCYGDITIAALTLNCDIIGNESDYAFNDCIKVGPFLSMRINWNDLRNKQSLAAIYAAHPDFVQWSLTGATADVDRLEFIGNRMTRGAGRAATYADGQGGFFDDLPSPYWARNIRMWGNYYLGTYVRGLSCTRTVDADIQYNTIVHDPTAGSLTTGIYLQNGTGGNIKNNVTGGVSNVQFGAVSANNVIVPQNTVAYAAAFVDPQTDAGVTDIASQYANKTGSAADLAVPKAGASPYFNYSARTYNIGGPTRAQGIASGIGVAIGRRRVAISRGRGIAAGVGRARGRRHVGTSRSVGTASGVGLAFAGSSPGTNRSRGTASGTGGAAAIGKSRARAGGAAAGTGVARGIAIGGASSLTATAAGIGTAAATGKSRAVGLGVSHGTATAFAMGRSVSRAIGAASGAGTTSGAAVNVYSRSTGLAMGGGFSLGFGTATINGISVVHGTVAVSVTGRGHNPDVDGKAGHRAAMGRGSQTDKSGLASWPKVIQ